MAHRTFIPRMWLSRARRWLVAGTILTGSTTFAVACYFVGQGAMPGSGGNLMAQSQLEADRKSEGCVNCHTDVEPMHASPLVKLGCTDCHGGNHEAKLADGVNPTSPEYEQTKQQAHVLPRFPERWKGADGKYSAANPERSYTLLIEESPEFVRFVNPGDLRAAVETCGSCHTTEVYNVKKSPMTTAAIF